MCHLSLEKMLKGLYLKNLDKTSPKIHSLVYFVQAQNFELPETAKKFLAMLDEVSIPTRYPDEIEALLAIYDNHRTQEILRQTQEVLICLREKFGKL